MGIKRSAGIACKYGNGSHGFAVRSKPDANTHMMCKSCADAFDALVDAQNEWQAAISDNARDNYRRDLQAVQT